MANRMPDLSPGAMTARQREVYDRMMSGPRHGATGPLAVWLRAPELADRAEVLGVYCRFGNSLEPRHIELAVLITARYWGAGFVWGHHVPMARNGGLPADVIEAIRTGRKPTFDRSDDQMAFEFLDELLRSKAVSDKVWTAAIAVLKEVGVVDLIGVAGYYGLVCMTVKAAAVGSDDADPFLA
jgi:4-carboxymuconolactone decarboxylase